MCCGHTAYAHIYIHGWGTLLYSETLYVYTISVSQIHNLTQPEPEPARCMMNRRSMLFGLLWRERLEKALVTRYRNVVSSPTSERSACSTSCDLVCVFVCLFVFVIRAHCRHSSVSVRYTQALDTYYLYECMHDFDCHFLNKVVSLLFLLVDMMSSSLLSSSSSLSSSSRKSQVVKKNNNICETLHRSKRSSSTNTELEFDRNVSE